MNQSLIAQFGTPQQRMEKAISSLKSGNGVLVLDDEDRENEGDLVFSADNLTLPQMALMIREGSGIVCLCMTDEKLKQLDLPPMVEDNTSKNKTAFTVSIEAKEGITTGVSAADRVTTVKAATATDAKPSDLCRPGHVFPLRARPGGVLERRGHTEATVDIMRLAGLQPAGVLCELANEDGSMARLPAIADFATKHAMTIITVNDIVSYRKESEGVPC